MNPFKLILQIRKTLSKRENPINEIDEIKKKNLFKIDFI